MNFEIFEFGELSNKNITASEDNRFYNKTFKMVMERVCSFRGFNVQRESDLSRFALTNID